MAARSPKILLLDDDAEFRALVIPGLSAQGFVVREAGSAAAALAVLQREMVDLAVVDGVLPDMSGVEFISELRRGYPEIPIIFVTGLLQDPALRRELVRDHHVSQVVHKPISPAEFALYLQAALDRGAAAKDGSGADPLAELKRDYAARLPEKMAVLVSCLRAARQGDRGALEKAYREAHKLHGTAASYGLPTVSQVAGALEALLQFQGAPVARADVDWAAIDVCAARLDATIGEVGGAAQSGTVVTAASKTERRVSDAMNILVVDDDPAFLSHASNLAGSLLLNVVTAGSEREALERAHRIHLDGALIDVHMGGAEDSFRLARRLRSVGAVSPMPIAFVSADDAMPNRIAALHAGASFFVRKPLDLQALQAVAQHFALSAGPEPARILILDDDPDFAVLVGSILEARGMQVDYLDQPLRIMERLEAIRPTVLLLDMVMPELSGLEVCRMLRASPEWRDLLIFFLTSHLGPEARLAGFDAGGDDYVPKPVLEQELLARIRVRTDRTRFAKERADRDALTGLYNRRAFVEAVSRQLADRRRHPRPLSLALLDLDHFKQVNDTHGHAAGDRVLAALGKLLASSFRTADLRARWGGEEFVVVLDGEDAEACEAVLRRTLEELREIVFRGDSGELFRMTFSAGIASFPEDASTLDQLVKVADERMYAAKAAGRDGVRGSSPPP